MGVVLQVGALVLRDNFSANAPHERDELDRGGVVAVYGCFAFIVVVVSVIVWWL